MSCTTCCSATARAGEGHASGWKSGAARSRSPDQRSSAAHSVHSRASGVICCCVCEQGALAVSACKPCYSRRCTTLRCCPAERQWGPPPGHEPVCGRHSDLGQRRRRPGASTQQSTCASGTSGSCCWRPASGGAPSRPARPPGGRPHGRLRPPTQRREVISLAHCAGHGNSVGLLCGRKRVNCARGAALGEHVSVRHTCSRWANLVPNMCRCGAAILQVCVSRQGTAKPEGQVAARHAAS